MESLVACILVAGIASVFILPSGSIRAFEKPRQCLVVLSVLILLFSALLRGLPVYHDHFILSLVFLMIAYWAFVSALSIRSKISFQHMVRFSGTVLFAFLLVPPEWRPLFVQISVSMAVVHSVVAIMQSKFKVMLFEKISTFKPNYACGLISRNPSMLATYLVPHFFMALWLGTASSPLWLMTLAPITWATWETKCRGSILAVLAGFLFLAMVQVGVFAALLPFGLLGLALAIDKKRRAFLVNRIETLTDRLKYLRVAMAGMAEMPIVGYGFDVIKTRVPQLQRQLNQETDGAFLADYHDPVPQKMHNDLVQTILDTGPVGAALVFGLSAMAVFTGLIYQQFFLAAALVALLVNGLFFHPFYFLPTNVVFWFLVSALLSPIANVQMFVYEPNVYTWVAYGAFAYLAYRYVILEQWNDYQRWAYYENPNEETFSRALAMHPASSRMAVWACNLWQGEKRWFEIIYVLTRAINQYDGLVTYWVLWSNLSLAYLAAGAPNMAHAAAKEALSYKPDDKIAQYRLDMAASIIDNMGGLNVASETELEGEPYTGNIDVSNVVPEGHPGNVGHSQHGDERPGNPNGGHEVPVR